MRDICYATQNRQTAVREMASECDVILVIGADYSSNSNRLREIGAEAGTVSYLIPDAESLDLAWLEEARTVGITAGASAPETLVQGLIDRLGTKFDVTVTDLDGIEENVTFRLPRQLEGREREQDELGSASSAARLRSCSRNAVPRFARWSVPRWSIPWGAGRFGFRYRNRAGECSRGGAKARAQR